MHRTFLLLGTVIIAATGLGGSVPPAAVAFQATDGSRAASPEYGMSVFVYDNPTTTQRDLGKLKALSFGWQKSLFSWRSIESRCKGCFTWNEADRVVRASAEAGLKIIARLDFQPGWARKDGASNGPPDNYADYADFVRSFVDRYKLGSPFGTVQAIQIWNEVNLDREWGGGPINRQSAADYVRLLSLAYGAAKAADPNVIVISAGLSPTGVTADFAQPDDAYLRWMYEAGLTGNYDVLGANANVQCPCVEAIPGSVAGFSHPSFYFRRVEQLHEIMVANGDADKQVWLMEFGWTTDRIHPSYAWYATTEDQKSELIVQAFRFAAEHWAPWIGVMTLWTVAAPHWGANDEQVWWAVTNPDGSPRPAYNRLLSAVAVGELPLLGPVLAAAAPAPPSVDAAVEVAGDAVSPSVEQLRVAATDGVGLNLRAGPSASTVRVKTLPPGTMLLAIGGARDSQDREWRQVSDPNGIEGWVAAEFVEPVPIVANPGPASPQRLRVAGTDGVGLNLRERPGASAVRVKTLPPGTVLLAVGIARDGEDHEWRQVRDPDGVEGWVAAEFVVPEIAN
jgi:SH3-like domain-containing protein